ncbi:MAG: ribosomal-processing cysteine protease Prp [Thermanaerothrix sp.]|nr:ribosomal-processing cysteine protease Prp [Thermanaerothrix sp.]
MTRVTFFFDSGLAVGFEAVGHSGAASRGEDVVCAAVSTLLQALELGITQVVGVRDLDFEVDPDKPLRRMIWGRLEGDGWRVLVETVRLSLKSLASSYPKHIVVSEVERNDLRF